MKEFLPQSQVLTTFGPGAMVDLPDRAVLIEGLQSWRFGRGREEVAEPRLVAKLRERLGLPSVRLVKPPAFDERPGAPHASIGARMWLEERGTSGDIAETVVACDCGIMPRSLYEALGIEARAFGFCQGKRPWLGPNYRRGLCNQPYRLLVRTSNAYFPQLFGVLSLPEEDPGLAARLDAVWTILEYATAADLPVYRKRPDVAKALEGLSDGEAMALIERRRAGGTGGAGAVPARQAEFEILNLVSGTRGTDDADIAFFAEVLALVGFSRFEAPAPTRRANSTSKA
jgi:hypothetical protein